MPTYSDSVLRGTSPSFTTASNQANPLIPIEFQREIIKNATEMSVVGQFARKRKMSTLLNQMPVLDVKPTAYFVTGDSGLKQTTAMQWRNVMLIAEEIAVLVPVPINLVNDIPYDIWAQIRPEVEEAIAVALDAAILFGTNKPALWPAALAPQAITAGNTVTHGAGVDVAADINNVLGALESDGYTASGIAMRQTLRANLRGLRDTVNGFIFKPGEPGAENTAFGSGAGSRKGTIFDTPAMSILSGVFEAEDVASANAVELMAVDWDQVILGIRQDVTVDFSKDAVITDGSGAIVYNSFQQDGVIGRFVARYGYAVPNPVSRTNSTTASRWPAAVLRMAA